MIHLGQQRTFRLHQWPFQLGQFQRVVNHLMKYPELDIMALAALLHTRLQAVAGFMPSYETATLVNVASPKHSRISTGIYPMPDPSVYPFMPRLMFTFARSYKAVRKNKLAYLRPTKVVSLNSSTRVWHVGKTPAIDYVTIAVTPVECQRLGIRNIQVFDLDALYSAIGLLTKNMLRTNGRNLSLKPNLFRQGAVSVVRNDRLNYTQWSRCLNMWRTPFVDLESPDLYAGLLALRTWPAIRRRYMTPVLDLVRDTLSFLPANPDGQGRVIDASSPLSAIIADGTIVGGRRMHMLMTKLDQIIANVPDVLKEFEDADNN